MNFASIEFLILLSATFVAYYLIFAINKLAKRKIIPQWSILLIASLIFYGFTNYFYLIFLFSSALVSYIISLLTQYQLFEIEVVDGKTKRKFKPKRIENHLDRKRYENILTAISIVINAGALAVLKYFNFFSTSIGSIFSFNSITYNFIIPLGISFYTFSLIAYNVDCCRREIETETNPLKFLLFVSYFPKVLQGPVSSYKRLKEDGLFQEHDFRNNNYLRHLFRISIGLIKKFAIANVLNLYVNSTYTNLNQAYGWSLILISIFYTIQLYCDFSGFIDISIGVSGLFGINLEENFNVPYLSSSIGEFWRRWHISLSNWLKKYIYIPLGGNRVPIWRWMINVFIVWLVSGLWHGANWTFVIWGLFHGLLIVIEGLPSQIRKRKGITSDKSERNKILLILSIALTFILVNLGWVFFRAPNIEIAGQYIWHSIKVWEPSAYLAFTDTSINKANWLLIVAFILISILIVIKFVILSNDVIKNEKIKTVVSFVTTALFFSFAVFVIIYLNSIGGGESSFIYFDF